MTASAIKVRLDETHLADLKSALAAVQTRRSQNGASAEDVFSAARRAEAALEHLGVARSRRRGASYVQADGGAACAAYRSAIATTAVELRRDGRGWALVGVKRIRQYPRARALSDLRLTREQSDSLADEKARAYETFTCRDGEVRKLARFKAAAPAVLKRALTDDEVVAMSKKLAAQGVEKADGEDNAMCGWTGGTAAEYADFWLEGAVGDDLRGLRGELTEESWDRLWRTTREALEYGYDPELHDWSEDDEDEEDDE